MYMCGSVSTNLTVLLYNVKDDGLYRSLNEVFAIGPPQVAVYHSSEEGGGEEVIVVTEVATARGFLAPDENYYGSWCILE